MIVGIVMDGGNDADDGDISTLSGGERLPLAEGRSRVRQRENGRKSGNRTNLLVTRNFGGPN